MDEPTGSDLLLLLLLFFSRMMELLAESKALVRLGITIPEVAQAALKQVLIMTY